LKEQMMVYVKVLGPGCRNCQKLEQVAKDAVAKLGVEASVEKVTDYADIMQYNILATPGLVVNEQLVAAGRVPSEVEVMAWLQKAQTAV